MSRLEPQDTASDARLEAHSAPSRRHKSDVVDVQQRLWWRHAAGLLCLTVTIFLWTASNFLSSTIFADDTYSKPFLVTYINTAAFVFTLIPPLVQASRRKSGGWRKWLAMLRRRSDRRGRYESLRDTEDEDEQETSGGDGGREVLPDLENSPERGLYPATISASQESLLGDTSRGSQLHHDASSDPLSMRDTAKLALEFCIIWFVANYAVGACLQYTTVASSTILTSTSSVFTLLFGVAYGVESFTFRKLLGILASLAGIVLISTIDLSGSNSDDEHRGDFPSKTPGELTLGNSLALLSAILYALYAVFMKHRIPNEECVNMPLFFGFVGLANTLLLWPGLVLLHFTGVEPFELPPTSRVTYIIISNAVVSLISDMTWAYAVVFTSPIVVTVGLSTTIPVSLIGQILLNHQTVGLWYWVGALVVVLSFVFVQQVEVVEDKSRLLAEADGEQRDD